MSRLGNDDPMHPSVAARLARLAADQRAAATAPPGPVLCVAPAGSGKTTVLVARIGWLIDGGADPERITALTFNRRAAIELRERVDPAVAPLGVAPGRVTVSTFHALGLEILRDAGVAGEDPVAERDAVLRETFPDATAPDRHRLDDAFSRLKLDAFVTAADIEADPDPGPIGAAFLAYQRALVALGEFDFDDLAAEAVRRLEADRALLDRWRERAADLLVDEAQDLDRTQLRLALVLSAPANRIFLVGDDDQSIYGWRLADVRRILELATALPGLRRFDLETNYRCPAVVIARADRLIRCNRERFTKHIRPREDAQGVIVLAADAGDDEDRADRIFAGWPQDEATRAILARTNRALHPAAIAAVRRGLPFRGPGVVLIVESPHVDALLEAADEIPTAAPLLPALAMLLERAIESGGLPPEPESDGAEEDGPSRVEVAAAILAWAAPYPTLETLAAAIATFRDRLADLRREDAQLDLATAHGTKGLEFDHVAVVDMDDGRFPSARSIAEATEPARAMEEERRLAYVAWTRARRTLTLAFDPGAPSSFLLEAFDGDELSAIGTRSARRR